MTIPHFITTHLDTKPVTLWVIDDSFERENVSCVAPRDHLIVLTNRFDLFKAFNDAGHTAHFNDFDLKSIWPKNCSQVIYEVSKERPVTNHVIESALTLLPCSGSFIFYGQKNQGIKTYTKYAQQFTNKKITSQKLGLQYLVTATANDNQEQTRRSLNSDYHQWQTMSLKSDQEVQTKPGIYGWNKEDKGSALLVEALKALDLSSTKNCLDLGCGYGYLSMAVQTLNPSIELYATDNNAAAIDACDRNLNHQKTKTLATITADDCGKNIHKTFDLIICNPPFHQGFNLEDGLLPRFLKSAYSKLDKKGVALFVVNEFIPLAKHCSNWFKHCDCVIQESGFKVYIVRH